MLSRRDLLALSAAAVGTAGLRPPLAFALLAAEDDPTRVFTGGKQPTDVRLGKPRDLNDYSPFVVPKSKEAWEARRTQLREQLLVANGLWPMPEKAPLNPVIHGKTAHDGYTIEKVFFASMPGHYVCGNLYRPLASGGGQPPVPGKLPGVLFAHGHWANGRFHDAGEKAAKESVANKGEPDFDRGRFFIQAIPVTLARLGFVVFQYDMVGYADSTAIPHREGFKDAEAELRLQSQMGLQTWNSLRALDFLASLPDVDPKKLGMTGASGGGTQTFMTAALDDRLAAAFPAVMVSTTMQGGCVCENCSLLRVNTNNVEIAALFAPKPQAFSCAKDWTAEFLTKGKGFPEIEQVYDLYDAKDKVAAKAWLEYGHQYNVHAREFMYRWFRKHLQGKDEEVKEAAYKPVPPKDLSVFDPDHPRPKDELDAPKLRAAMTTAGDDQMAKLAPKDADSLKEFKRVVGTALQAMLNDRLPEKPDRQLWPRNTTLGDYTGLLSASGRGGSHVPSFAVWGPRSNNIPVIWVHPKGKASLLEDGKLVPAAKAIVDAGYLICAPDVLGVGELAVPKPFPVDKNFAGYTYGYNRSLLASRVHDVLTVLAERRRVQPEKPCHLVGWGEMGVVAVLAKALAGDAVTKTAADLNQFRFEAIKDAADPMMLPGAVKYGGLPAFLALCAPGEVLAHNHKGTSTGKLPKAAYDAAGAADKLTRSADKLDDAKVVEWLVK